MTPRPHDVADLYLAPVVLTLDERIEELAALSREELDYRVTLATNRQPQDQTARQKWLLETVVQGLELHGWQVSWHPRGLQVAHDKHILVLGLSPNLHEYLGG